MRLRKSKEVSVAGVQDGMADGAGSSGSEGQGGSFQGSCYVADTLASAWSEPGSLW